MFGGRSDCAFRQRRNIRCHAGLPHGFGFLGSFFGLAAAILDDLAGRRWRATKIAPASTTSTKKAISKKGSKYWFMSTSERPKSAM